MKFRHHIAIITTFFFIICSQVFSDDYFLLYEGSYTYNSKLFSKLQKQFSDHQQTLHILDWKEAQEDVLFIRKALNRHTKYVLLYTFNYDAQKKFLDLIPKKKRAFIIFEGPVVYPKYYRKKFLNKFSLVFTFHDGLVNQQQFFKYRYICLQPMISEVVSFNDRKLACLINANKKWNHVNDITSERRKVITFYERQPIGLFDLYGMGWSHLYKNNKGKTPNKIETTKNYKFCYCFENTKNVPGYVTEKIFDCFAAGVVPIYYGAPNITEEIPSDCFIDYRDFSSLEQVHQFIANMDEKTFMEYLENIRLFLSSKQAHKYTDDAFVESIFNAFVD